MARAKPRRRSGKKGPHLEGQQITEGDKRWPRVGDVWWAPKSGRTVRELWKDSAGRTQVRWSSGLGEPGYSSIDEWLEWVTGRSASLVSRKT